MIKMVAILNRKPGTSPEEFRQHYETRHVPLVKGLMGDNLVHYIRNYTLSEGPFPVGSGPDFDCITEFHFKDQASFERAVAAIEHPDNAPTVRADEARFLDVARVRISMVDAQSRTDGKM